MTRDEILSANPIADFVRNRGHELKPAGQNFRTNACPVTHHKKYHRPVTIDPAKNLWHCNDCKVGGSVIDWLAKEKGIPIADAMQELAGGRNGSKSIKKTKKSAAAEFDWHSCVDALTDEDLIRLGNQRWWSRAFCVWLRDEKKIGLHKGHYAFPVEREGKIVAAKYKWGPGPNDWAAYPTEQGAACFVLGDPKKGEQKRQNPPREALGNRRTGNFGGAVRVNRTGRRLQNHRR
jgi:hypothetical protein